MPTYRRRARCPGREAWAASRSSGQAPSRGPAHRGPCLRLKAPRHARPRSSPRCAPLSSLPARAARAASRGDRRAAPPPAAPPQKGHSARPDAPRAQETGTSECLQAFPFCWQLPLEHLAGGGRSSQRLSLRGETWRQLCVDAPTSCPGRLASAVWASTPFTPRGSPAPLSP